MTKYIKRPNRSVKRETIPAALSAFHSFECSSHLFITVSMKDGIAVYSTPAKTLRARGINPAELAEALTKNFGLEPHCADNGTPFLSARTQGDGTGAARFVIAALHQESASSAAHIFPDGGRA